MEKDRDGWYDDFFGRMGKGAAKAAHPEVRNTELLDVRL